MTPPHVLLTGHTKGIGNELLQILLTNNCFVTGIARSKVDVFSEKLVQYSCDLSDEKSTKLLCKNIARQQPNVLILNAGYNDIRPAESYSVDEIFAIMQANFTSHAALVKTFLPVLIKTQGWIIGVGSFSATEQGKWNNYYGAAKAALHHFLKNLFEQYRKQGLKTCTVIPDITASAFYEHQKFEPSKEKECAIQPKDVAVIISKLILEPKDFVTTEIIIRPQKFMLNKK